MMSSFFKRAVVLEAHLNSRFCNADCFLLDDRKNIFYAIILLTLHHIPERILRLLPGADAMLAAKRWGTISLTRFLLFAYTLFLLKPVMPILVDSLAHTFWKNVHIAVVHKVNGKEHVHYELSRAGKDLDKEKSNGKFKTETEFTSYLAVGPYQVLKPALVYHTPAKYRVFASRLPESFQEQDCLPPKC